MSRRSSVTIGIPVFNGMHYLGKAIESALMQTHEDVAVIVYCDGCTDASPAVARRYADEDKRVKVIECSENKGLGPARNAIIAVADSDFIAFLDADDILAPQAVEMALAAAESENAEMVRYDYCRFSNRDAVFSSTTGSPAIFSTCEEREKTALSIFISSLYGGRFSIGGSACTCLYRLVWLKERNLLFDDDRTCSSEDYLFNFECVLAASKIVALNSVLYGYRHNLASKTHVVDPDFAATSERYCRKVERLCCRILEPPRAAAIARRCMAEMILGLGKNTVLAGLPVKEQKSWFERQISSSYVRSVTETGADKDMGFFRRVACRAFCTGRFRLWRMLVLGRELIRRLQRD